MTFSCGSSSDVISNWGGKPRPVFTDLDQDGHDHDDQDDDNDHYDHHDQHDYDDDEDQSIDKLMFGFTTQGFWSTKLINNKPALLSVNLYFVFYISYFSL